MNETIAAYLEFLWQQFQYDWSWMSNPWMLYTVIPVALYFVFFFLKWTVLLAPITVPLTIWKWPSNNNKAPEKRDDKFLNN